MNFKSLGILALLVSMSLNAIMTSVQSQSVGVPPPEGNGIDISFSSYIPSATFTYGQNFRSPGNSFPIQVPKPLEFNAISFYLSDRAYDPTPINFNIQNPSGQILATGIFPGTPMFASQQYFPVQLSQLVTFQAGVTYTVAFAQLPQSDTYQISQDILQESSAGGVSYLGQSQWPLFQLCLMNLLPQSQGLAYRNYGGYTDLFSSPGYHETQGYSEIAMRFKASQTENLQSFEIYIWSTDSSSNQVMFSLRPDSNGHPAPFSSSIATTSLGANQVTAGNFATISFSNPQLTGGNYYWIVMSSPSNTRPIVFGRLVSPYREYVLESPDAESTWSVPSDGPSDLGFKISTSVESITNTISGSSDNDYFGGIGQSFVPSSSLQVKGAWLSAWPAGEPMTVSIQTDNGNDQPSGNMLAQGTETISTQFTGGDPAFIYVGFSSYATVNSGTKYWLVAKIGSCLSSSCSQPSKAATLQFSSDYSSSGFAPQSGTHYDMLQGNTWQVVTNGAMVFNLVSPTGNENDAIWQQGQTSTTSTTSTSTSSSTTSSSSQSTTPISTSSTSTSSTYSTSSSSTGCSSCGADPSTLASWILVVVASIAFFYTNSYLQIPKKIVLASAFIGFGWFFGFLQLIALGSVLVILSLYNFIVRTKTRRVKI